MMKKTDNALRRKGDCWNESFVASDPVTERKVRRLTAAGFNEKPTYHTNTAFTADGEFMVFVSGRVGQTALMKAHLASGELTQLTEPVQGLVSRTDFHKLSAPHRCPGDGIDGTRVCLAPRTHWTVFIQGRSLRSVQLDSLDERTLIEDMGEDWLEGAISIDPAETEAIVPLIPAHPELRKGLPRTRDYIAHFAASGGMRTRYMRVPLTGGPAEDVFIDEGRGNAHCPHCSADGKLLLIDRDLPPKFWCGGDDGKTNRCWILNLETKALTPIVPRNRQRFQVHACWTFDGRYVFYHGWRAEGGWYVGVADRNGRIVREHDFPDAIGYGHVSADPKRQAIILDGNVTKDMLMWLFWDADTPRLEPICRHTTEWDSLWGQLHDPHPAADPTGRWIGFNAAHGGRSDVFVVDVEKEACA
ncbi:MAG: hypothetical protein KKG09_10105 [Verrucomicrobia bacterium]|nr:hypothetical protein [Verrucomicrobiota bacterium]MBU4291053.1 hypothetical protein [Verrucomicrobiota bacterium]MBU4498344.1 hypothetical protein [Verrucomicrobiota bacterium]MCG2679449.1 hypothetical protein [Kiritimatiellia bacterium]MCG2819444.1 hypothetical protein [Actinomycetes bacterium]